MDRRRRAHRPGGRATVGDTSDLALSFARVDAAGRVTGPVTDLQPYLGAAGHVVVMRADGSTFAHRHAETFDGRGRPVLALPGSEFGPDLDLHVRFDRQGVPVVGPSSNRRRHGRHRPVRAPPAAGRRAPGGTDGRHRPLTSPIHATLPTKDLP